jgi:hypothetical protein
MRGRVGEGMRIERLGFLKEDDWLGVRHILVDRLLIDFCVAWIYGFLFLRLRQMSPHELISKIQCTAVWGYGNEKFAVG